MMEKTENEHEGRTPVKERNGPETQNLPTIPELFVRAAPRLGVLARDSPYAYNGHTGAPDKDEREGKDESDFRGDVFLRLRLAFARRRDGNVVMREKRPWNSRPYMPQSSLRNPQHGGGTLRFVGQVRAGAASARSAGMGYADSAEIRVPLGQAHLGRRNKGRQCLEFSGVCPMSYICMKKGCADFEGCPWTGYSTFCNPSTQCHAKCHYLPALLVCPSRKLATMVRT